MEENRLIELLDEYDSVQYHKINHKIENGSIYRNVGGTDGWHEVWRYCKPFGFIKWLVDNDKIDFSLIPNKIKEIGIPIKINGEIKYGFDSSDYYWLLMLLSIQDNPIEFLISILK